MENHLDKKLEIVEKIIAKNPQADFLTLLNEKSVRKNHNFITKNYIISLFLFPFGAYLFLKLYFLEEEPKEAIICLIITFIVGFIALQGFNNLFSLFVNHSHTILQLPGVNSGF